MTKNVVEKYINNREKDIRLFVHFVETLVEGLT
jgi:hypothetical protein